MPATPKTPKSTREGTSTSQTYRNTGPKTKTTITAFEGTYRYTPVFEADDAEREKTGGVANRLVARLWDTKERLKQMKSSKSPQRRFTQNDTPLKYVQDTYKSLFGDEDSRELSLAPEQLQILNTNCDRIGKVIDRLCDVLGLVNPSVAPPMNLRRTASDLIGANDEGDILEWAPGICEPQRIKEMGNTLTLRGRNQVLLSYDR